MNDQKNNPPTTNKLFNRIVTILEDAKTNVIRTVNSQMIIAYWLIGRELVQTIQQGDERAAYGKEIINQLSTQLNQKFDKGFSATNLWYFRQFYQVFAERSPEIRPISDPQHTSEILHKPCGESELNENNIIPHTPCGVSDSLDVAVEKSDTIKGFSPALSWSHYRTLAKVKHKCYLIIDLKIGKMTHQDIGQIDSYVRMYDDVYTAEDDNPTIGLLLCSEKNETIAKYSVLNESRQLFASKYLTYLPSEEELQKELKREREIIEERSSIDEPDKRR